MFFGRILFSMSKELRFVKWATIFEQNCIVKWVMFFRWFLFALRLSARKSGIKRTLMMRTGVRGPKLYTRNNIFKKRITNMRFWIIYILVQVSFLGTALGRLSKWVFLIFRRWSTMVADIFTQSPLPNA